VDQPTAGVDSERRAHVWAALAAHAERGGAAIVATDALDEAEAIASKIVVMRGGRVVAADAPAALKARCATSYRLEATLGKEATTEDAIEALDAPTLEERGAPGTGEGRDRDPRDPLRPPTETLVRGGGFDSRTSDHFARVAARSRRRRRGGSSALSALGAAKERRYDLGPMRLSALARLCATLDAAVANETLEGYTLSRPTLARAIIDLAKE
jgi:ABC-type proline/glycine betaine transport system ATPase subunit